MSAISEIDSVEHKASSVNKSETSKLISNGNTNLDVKTNNPPQITQTLLDIPTFERNVSNDSENGQFSVQKTGNNMLGVKDDSGRPSFMGIGAVNFFFLINIEYG